jgi:hypothetical protein
MGWDTYGRNRNILNAGDGRDGAALVDTMDGLYCFAECRRFGAMTAPPAGDGSKLRP